MRGLLDCIGREGAQQAVVAHDFGSQIEQLDTFDAAHAAAGTPGQRAALIFQAHERLLHDGEVHGGTVVADLNLDVLDIVTTPGRFLR